MALILAVSGCGGDADGQGATGEQSVSPTVDPDAYKIANREQFLATGPDCDAMTAWFTHNPRDENLDTIGRHVEECGTIPEAFADNGYVLLELRSQIFESTSAGDEDRQNLHRALAAEACTTFDEGSLSPYGVAQDIDIEGGTAEDTSAVLALAASTCTEHAADLQVFKDTDLIQAAEELTAYVDDQWPDALADTNVLVGLAQMVCKGDSDPFEQEVSDSLIESGVAEGAAEDFRAYVQANLCRS